MVSRSPATWVRYMLQKFDHSISIGIKALESNTNVDKRKLGDVMAIHFWKERLTKCYWSKGKEMIPTIAEDGSTLLIRRLPSADPTHVAVGDVIMLKDPKNANQYLFRRLAAVEGDEMISKDEKDEPFLLEKDQCWVLADNETLKAKEAFDSRLFGPVSMSDIVGRVIYCLKSAIDHGPVINSEDSMEKDQPVLHFELNVEELAEIHKGEGNN